MSYIPKQFDVPLMAFNITSGGIKGVSVELIELNETHRMFYPIDLELTDKVLMRLSVMKTGSSVISA